MQFGLNESQEFLRDSARKFFAGECPITRVRRLMETETAFDANLWAKLAGQGYTGIIFPEEFGGVGLGIVELIGMFQAVQHQCADMYLETESARSAVYYAAWALQHHAPDAAAAVSIAKLYASDASRTVGNRGIQVHGGMGFTWENDVHLYYRRAKASETVFGDATFHRERLARLTIDEEAVSAQGA